jgi:hypothetical protein
MPGVGWRVPTAPASICPIWARAQAIQWLVGGTDGILSGRQKQAHMVELIQASKNKLLLDKFVQGSCERVFQRDHNNYPQRRNLSD